MKLSLRALAALAFSGALAIACSSSEQTDDGPPLGDNGDDTPVGPIVGVDDGADAGAVDPGAWTAGTKVRATADLNLRDAPSTSGAILRVIPTGSLVTILDPKPQNGTWWNVEFDGVRGWVSGKYLEADKPVGPASGLDGPASPTNALSRARAVVGFSYWWGGGAWLGTGVTSATAGTCTGNCGACSHTGSYGADCSGMVAKAWQYGNKDLAVNSHPYNTGAFVVPKAGYWSDVSRAALHPGDALVYSTGSEGHIVLWEKGDGWGVSTVYECKGCSYGCVHDARTFTSAYKAIRRDGF
jgi:cell wall-associated NlpC family hydrolase